MLFIKKLLKSTAAISGITFCSRILGFSRDLLFASLFGATAGFDAFLVAFRIPNFLRALFAEGAFAQAWVPILTESRLDASWQETRELVGNVFGVFTGVLLLITVICELAAPFILFAVAPGFSFDSLRYQLAVHMLRVVLPYLPFISLTAFCGAVMNAIGKFTVPALTPLLLNLILIISAISLTPLFDVPEQALAWGVFIAGTIQLGWQLFFLYRLGLLSCPRLNWQHPVVKRLIYNFVPAIFGGSALQIGLLINTFFASFLGVGSISWLYFADRLTFLPVGIFGVALGTRILPQLTLLQGTKSYHLFDTTLDWSIKVLLMVSLPAMIGLIILSGPITIVLFQHGQFNAYDVAMTQQCVINFALGIPSYALIKVMISAFYAKRDVKRPAQIALWVTSFNICTCLLLLKPLAHMGIALATALTASFNVIFLYHVFAREHRYKPLPGWRPFLVQLGSANGTLALFLLSMVPNSQSWLLYTRHSQMLALGLWLIGASCVYLICLWFFGLQKYLSHPQVIG